MQILFVRGLSRGYFAMTATEILREKRSEIIRVAAQYGASDIRVFGSVSRGEADTDSDIDLLVRPAPDFTLLQHAALIRELESLLGCKVDVVSERGLRRRVRENVLKEAVPI
jgi:uncharacterized protein